MPDITYIQKIARHHLENIAELPDTFPIHENYRNGLDFDQLASGVREYHLFTKELYGDVMMRPEAYGLPIYQVSTPNTDDNAFKKSSQEFNRITGFLYCLGNGCELGRDEKGTFLYSEGRSLSQLFSAVKASKPDDFIAPLEKMGLVFQGPDAPLGNQKLRSAAEIRVRHKKHPFMPAALKAFASANLNITKNIRAGRDPFIRVDCRILKGIDGKEPKLAFSEALNPLNSNCAAMATELVSLITDMGYKADTRINALRRGVWTSVFTHPKIKKTLFSFKVEENRLEIKLNLTHIDRYIGFVDQCPEGIKSPIRNSFDCGSCSPRCSGGFSFTLDGVGYKKCRCLSFYFKDPNINHLPIFKGLLELQAAELAK